MRILFDSSALYKRYHKEAGADRVADLRDQASSIAAARHCKVEIASALNRGRHDGLMSADEYAQIMASVQDDFADIDVIEISPMVEVLAIAAMERSRLRGMDALHIGSALVERVDLFVTADRKQALAAQAAGLKTEYVGVIAE